VRLREVGPGEDRTPFLPLLLLADDAEDHVRRHLDDGQLFVLETPDDGEPVGAVQAVPRPEDDDAGHAAVELTLVAVAEHHQGAGHGRTLVRLTLDELRRQGRFTRVLVGTSNAGIGQIAFYQKCGFRLLRIERDHFDAARGYDGTETENGIVHRDLVWFDQSLVDGD
jgi:ribosomal protein S18 acetylase RimI-like enzyme